MPSAFLPSPPLGKLSVAAYRAFGAVLVIVGIWVLVLLNIQSDRQLLINDALTKAHGYADSFAENLQ